MLANRESFATQRHFWRQYSCRINPVKQRFQLKLRLPEATIAY